MGLDINTKKLKKNAFRVSKVRGIGASRIRVPGGYLDARVLGMVQEIAQEYGNGFVHLTTRQGFEIEGIRLKDMEAINRYTRGEQSLDNDHDSLGVRNVYERICGVYGENGSLVYRRVGEDTEAVVTIMMKARGHVI